MANIIREALNADQMSLTLFVGGQTRVGFGVTGTWTGTVSFFVSYDGVNFKPFPLSVRPFASGTTIQSTTANGNWEADVGNAIAVRVVFSRTTGTVVVALAASTDASYQDAFLASTSIYVTNEQTGGTTNTLTQAAQANRAWRLRTLVVAFSVAPAAAVKLQVTDGASTALATYWIPPFLSGSGTTVGGQYQVPLPAPTNTPGLLDGGLVNTPGNSMVLTLTTPGGSVTSELNAEFSPA